MQQKGKIKKIRKKRKGYVTFNLQNKSTFHIKMFEEIMK